MTIQRAITLINLAFITLGAYFAAGLFYQIWGLQLQPKDSAQIARASTQVTRPNAPKPYGAYRAIVQRDLFKTQKSMAGPIKVPSADIENMEETKLNLKLWGTVTGNTDRSYAVIENTQNKEQNLYRIGDSVQNATLKMILRSKVVLSVNGRDEVLAMEEIKQSPRQRYVGARTPRIGPRPGGIRTQRVSLRRSMINDAIQDVSKLMTEIKITPNVDANGQPSGLVMSNIKPNSVFRRMGLRNGDILKSVDGQQIQSVDDALKLYENLKSADRVAVEIQRRGRGRTIEYNIR